MTMKLMASAHFSESFRWMGNAGCGFKQGLQSFKIIGNALSRYVSDKVCIDEARLVQGEWAAAFGRQEAIHSGDFMGVRHW